MEGPAWPRRLLIEERSAGEDETVCNPASLTGFQISMIERMVLWHMFN